MCVCVWMCVSVCVCVCECVCVCVNVCVNVCECVCVWMCVNVCVCECVCVNVWMCVWMCVCVNVCVCECVCVCVPVVLCVCYLSFYPSIHLTRLSVSQVIWSIFHFSFSCFDITLLILNWIPGIYLLFCYQLPKFQGSSIPGLLKYFRYWYKWIIWGSC